jgi:hypothetical protein
MQILKHNRTFKIAVRWAHRTHGRLVGVDLASYGDALVVSADALPMTGFYPCS